MMNFIKKRTNYDGMQKITAVLLMAIMILSIIPATFAEDESDDAQDNADISYTDDNQEMDVPQPEPMNSDDSVSDDSVSDDSVSDEEETTIMNIPIGAEVRLLQLRYSLERNILRGENIMRLFKNKDESTDLSVLEGIISDIESLKEDVSGSDISEGPSVLAEKYVEIKDNARELSKMFREEARAIAKNLELDASELRKKAEDRAKERLSENKNLRNRIKEKLKLLNIKNLNRISERYGLSVESVKEKIQSGELTVRDAAKRLREQVKSLSPEEKKLIRAKIKENKAKSVIFARKAIESAKQKTANRILQIKERIRSLRGFSENQREVIEQNIREENINEQDMTAKTINARKIRGVKR